MPCYICRTTTGPFQRLEVARLRFIRKAHPNFKDNSYLCPKCFKQFERIYRMKPKGQGSNSSQISLGSKSIRSASSSKESSASGITTIQNSKSQKNDNSKNTDSESQENMNSNSNTSELAFNFDSKSHDDSVDSTDRIVRLQPEFVSIQDSTRKTAKNAELNVARQGAEAAVEDANRRQRYLSRIENTPIGQSLIRKSRKRKPDDDGNDSSSGDKTIDSAQLPQDRLIQMNSDFIFPRLSPAKVRVLEREKSKTPPPAPAPAPASTGKRRSSTAKTQQDKRPSHITGDDTDDADSDYSPPQLSPNNLAHTRPIARRRKEPVIQMYDDIMGLYIARTSGG